ncbi:MAG: hypothetical protein O2913_03950 [Chloroflexi bacterium]|nr:hypothetical protein [Chloroflexota bacterium]
MSRVEQGFDILPRKDTMSVRIEASTTLASAFAGKKNGGLG